MIPGAVFDDAHTPEPAKLELMYLESFVDMLGEDDIYSGFIDVSPAGSGSGDGAGSQIARSAAAGTSRVSKELKAVLDRETRWINSKS